MVEFGHNVCGADDILCPMCEQHTTNIHIYKKPFGMVWTYLRIQHYYTSATENKFMQSYFVSNQLQLHYFEYAYAWMLDNSI